MLRTKALFIALAFASVCLAKAAIQQEESQARLSSAEREQARPKGKDIKTVVLTTNPQMHCANCEKKIKENIRFEKGIKSIKTDLDTKTVTIEYDADKTTVPAIIEGFKKIKYEAKEVTPAPKKVDAETGATNVSGKK